MNISGDHHFAAPPDSVYSALTDPAKVQPAIDVCRGIEASGPSQYDVHLLVNVLGLPVRQTIRLTVQDRQPPRTCTFALDATSQFGNLRGTVAVKLSANEGGTLLEYAGDLELTGLLGSLSQPLLEAHAHRSLGQFFAKLAQGL